MDNKNPYQQIEKNLQNINQEDLVMDSVPSPVHHSPPAYNGHAGHTIADQPIMPQGMSTITVTSEAAAMPGGFPITAQPVGPHPAEMTCPHCRCRIRTRVDHRSTVKTHIACLLLSWTLCCCCLPYCMDSCRNTNHFCSMCGAYIGTYAS